MTDIKLVHKASYEQSMAITAARVREAKYEASLPKPPPEIVITDFHEIPDAICAFARSASVPLKQGDIFTLVGMILEAVGNPDYAGFAEKYGHTLPPLKP